MNGRKLYVRPPMIAHAFPMKLKSCPNTLRAQSVTVDWLPRIDVQAIVRMRNDVKNGMTTSPISRSFHFPPYAAMQYASGYPMTNVRTVATAAYANDRTNCGP